MHHPLGFCYSLTFFFFLVAGCDLQKNEPSVHKGFQRKTVRARSYRRRRRHHQQSRARTPIGYRCVGSGGLACYGRGNPHTRTEERTAGRYRPVCVCGGGGLVTGKTLVHSNRRFLWCIKVNAWETGKMLLIYSKY